MINYTSGIFVKMYENIKKQLDELNGDLSHYKNRNDICTPMDCVEEMVNVIPESFWQTKDLKILDCCCGNGNFHAYIQSKTHIDNLYFNEINEDRIKNLIKIFGDKINLTKKDFMIFSQDEKYDMVVANPPYAYYTPDGKRAAKNHNLSRLFIEKALKITKDNGYILFIAPNNWMSYSDRNILPQTLSKYQFLHINIGGAKKYFKNVGSSFTWFLLKKSPNKQECTIENFYKIKDKVKVKIEENSPFIPLYYNDITQKIIKKIVLDESPKYKIETTSDLHRTTKSFMLSPNKDDLFKYKIWHTPTQQIWSKVEHKYQKGYKVFISLTNQYKSFVDDGGMTQSIAFILCADESDAIKIKNELDNPIYKFVAAITRYGNFNNIRVLQNLTTLENVKMTKEVLDFVSKFNDAYYGKKKT